MTLSDVCNIPAVIWISNWKFFCVVVAALGQKPFRTSKQTNPLTRPSLLGPFSQQTTEQRCCGYHGEEAWKFWKSEKFLKNSKFFWRLTFSVNWWIKFAFWSSLYKFWSMHNFAHHQIRHFNSSTSGDQHSNKNSDNYRMRQNSSDVLFPTVPALAVLKPGFAMIVLMSHVVTNTSEIRHRYFSQDWQIGSPELSSKMKNLTSHQVIWNRWLWNSISLD